MSVGPTEPAPQDRRSLHPTRSRRHDAALLLPVAGAIALLPPLIGFFGHPGRIFGLPIVVVYVFGLWIVLIAVAARLSRLLCNEASPKADQEEPR